MSAAKRKATKSKSTKSKPATKPSTAAAGGDRQPSLPAMGSPHGKAKRGNSNLMRVQVMLEPHELELLRRLKITLSPHAPLSESACARACLREGMKRLAVRS